MTHEQQEEFQRLAEPLIEWLNKNTNPHTYVIVSTTSAEVVSGEMSFYTEAHVKD